MPRRMKDVLKMIPMATMLGAQHHKVFCHKLASLNGITNETRKKKPDNNVCIHQRTVRKSCILAKYFP